MFLECHAGGGAIVLREPIARDKSLGGSRSAGVLSIYEFSFLGFERYPLFFTEMERFAFRVDRILNSRAL
jgi:hypothetical protein